MTRVLFLCHGNICRSPMAEFVFKQLAQGYDIAVESKAVSREEIGNPIYPRAAQTLRQHGIPFDDHRARQIAREDYDAFDYIVVMEEYNLPRLMRIIGEDTNGKVYRLLDFTDIPGDIEDPWYSGNFDRVYCQIETGCKGLLQHIKNTEA
ncbi:MAG: low molecular weight phosphotyrosine protein phosphatase [Clostridia bacterium]|nr:low molecular weight phosphotyrosine protein phosphatase [Clostridia bacterium]